MEKIKLCSLDEAIILSISKGCKIRPLTWRIIEEKLRCDIVAGVKYPYVMYLVIEEGDDGNPRFVKYTYKDNNKIFNCHFNPQDLICQWEILED